MKLVSKIKRSNITNTIISVVDQETLCFFLPQEDGSRKKLDPLSLYTLLSESQGLTAEGQLLEAAKKCPHGLMLVPDYWIGNASFIFQAKKKNLIEAFIARKLQNEHPDLPDMKNFFEYSFFKSAAADRNIYTFFPLEPTFFHLYNYLAEENLAPRQITTAALIWQNLLKHKISDFSKGGKAFIHLLAKECFLYFFFEGNFLFSRNINLPETSEESPETFKTLHYEINQSIYLFSQKTHVEIHKIYLSSFKGINILHLSEELNKEVLPFSLPGVDPQRDLTLFDGIGPLSAFDNETVSQADRFPSLSHKQTLQENKWRPIQTSGMAVGFCLCLLLLAEGFLLWKWSRPDNLLFANQGTYLESGSIKSLPEYRNILNFLLNESQRPDPTMSVVNLARALPESILLKRIHIEVDPTPGIEIKAIMTAEDPEQFREILRSLLDNLNQYFEGSRSLDIQDIDFDTNTCVRKEGRHNCTIMLRFNLP